MKELAVGKVWIAEKPSAAQDLAAGLCLAFGCTQAPDKSGLIKLSNGDTICPLAGHLLTTVKPGAYLSKAHAAIEGAYDFDRYKEFLPILPTVLLKVPRTEIDSKGRPTNKLMGAYVRAVAALKGATEIVNAGDKDREGQLIVDELLEHLGIDPYGTKPMVWRLAVVSNIAADIAELARRPLERNSSPAWRQISASALTRQRLDFVWGMNLSMVGQVNFRSPRVSAGRVQTPVLNMVNKRDLAIENFKPTKYFVPVVVLKDGTQMRWYRREGCEGAIGFDGKGRITDRNLAAQIVARIAGGMAGEVTAAETNTHAMKPPLPFSSGTLLSTASKELGVTLAQAEELAKGLYQKKAISYPGTDCKYLPTTMHARASVVLQALGGLFPKLAPGADPALVSPAFNDGKLDEHFAIIPTGTIPKTASAEEMGMLRIVARRYISQFFPDYVYATHRVEAEFGADAFKATEKEELRKGWREVEGEFAADESRANSQAHEKDDERASRQRVEAHAC